MQMSMNYVYPQVTSLNTVTMTLPERNERKHRPFRRGTQTSLGYKQAPLTLPDKKTLQHCDVYAEETGFKDSRVWLVLCRVAVTAPMLSSPVC